MHKRLYLCDGLACSQKCAETFTVDEWDEYECHHTSDQTHARNKVRRDRKFEANVDKQNNIIFIEKKES